MPLFEYRCENCGLTNTLLVYSWSRDTERVCPGCSSPNLTRLVSRFVQGRSWGESLDWAPSGETLSDVNEDDPRSIDGFMGRIKDEMGGQVTSEFEQMRREWRPKPDPP